LAAWLIGLLALKLLWPVLGTLLFAIFWLCDMLFGAIFGARASELLWNLLCLALNVAVLGGILAMMIPGFRSKLPATLRLGIRLFRFIWDLAKPAVQFTFHFFKALVQGVHHETKNHKNH
jgi:hypothetical protein